MTFKFKLETLFLLLVLSGFVLFINQSLSVIHYFWISFIALLYFFPYHFIKTILDKSFKKNGFLNVLIPLSIILCYLPFHVGMTGTILYLILINLIGLVILLFMYALTILENGTEFTLGSICILLLTSVLAVHF